MGAWAAHAEGLKIGFSQVTLQSPFYVQLKNGAEAAAKAGGDTLTFLDANGDVTKQNNDIQDLITQGVNAIIINPVNPDAVAPSLEAAKAAGIPVITVDRPINGEGVTAHIGRDNKKMGGIVGQAVVDRLKKDGVGAPPSSRSRATRWCGDDGPPRRFPCRDQRAAGTRSSKAPMPSTSAPTPWSPCRISSRRIRR